MNTKTEDALKMAIEAIEYTNWSERTAKMETALEACKEALEQPAQEPVAWMKNALDNARDVCKYLDHDMIKEAKAHTKFFWNDLDKIRDFDDTHPAPSWQGLSDDEIEKIYADTEPDSKLDTYYIVLSRAIEQALKERNI